MSAPEPKVLSKIEAAARQLDTAIWLWFNEGDIVSIQNLTGAAFGILDDLLHVKKKGRPVPFHDTPAGMKPREWITLLKSAQDFAKHARKDPEGLHPYDPEFVEIYLFCAVIAHETLDGGKDRGLQRLFVFQFGITHSAVFSAEGFKPLYEGLDVEALKKLSRSEFFQRFGNQFVGNPPRLDDF